MIVTEEEAKTKVCCGGEGCGEVVNVPLGLVEDNYERRCLGSLCMAWRWAWQDGAAGPAGEKPVHLCTDFGRTPLGYCGKAGKP